MFLQVVEKSRLGFKRTEAFLEAHVDSFVEQIGCVHKVLLWVLRQPEYEEFCVCCSCITDPHACIYSCMETLSVQLISRKCVTLENSHCKVDLC